MSLARCRDSADAGSGAADMGGRGFGSNNLPVQAYVKSHLLPIVAEILWTSLNQANAGSRALSRNYEADTFGIPEVNGG